MATLDLVPKVPVLIVQGGVFLANIVVVKKLFVDPYLKLKDRRDALTVGNQDSAIKILKDCETINGDITTRLEKTYTDSAKGREEVRSGALSKRTDMLKVAEEEARKHVAAIELEIKSEIENEKKKIPEVVNALTQEFYQKTLS